jgi:hypothetical protein
VRSSFQHFAHLFNILPPLFLSLYFLCRKIFGLNRDQTSTARQQPLNPLLLSSYFQTCVKLKARELAALVFMLKLQKLLHEGGRPVFMQKLRKLSDTQTPIIASHTGGPRQVVQYDRVTIDRVHEGKAEKSCARFK